MGHLRTDKMSESLPSSTCLPLRQRTVHSEQFPNDRHPHTFRQIMKAVQPRSPFFSYKAPDPFPHPLVRTDRSPDLIHSQVSRKPKRQHVLLPASLRASSLVRSPCPSSTGHYDERKGCDGPYFEDRQEPFPQLAPFPALGQREWSHLG